MGEHHDFDLRLFRDPLCCIDWVAQDSTAVLRAPLNQTLGSCVVGVLALQERYSSLINSPTHVLPDSPALRPHLECRRS
jgi:hypothetical protein